MKFEIEVTEKEIQDEIVKIIAQKISTSYMLKQQINKEISREVGKAAHDYIYSQKGEIIEKVIDRATREIVKKGLPKLLDRVELIEK